ncbi:MAG: fatty acid--CoA ligase family protein [Bacteroidia bacterium]|nr:fatty acid--CoA ligase family protein [Bacteroidia bacterium]
MDNIKFLIDVFTEERNNTSIIWRNKKYDYGWLIKSIKKYRNLLDESKVLAGTVCAIQSNYSPNTIALFFAMISKNCIVVPITSINENQIEYLVKASYVDLIFRKDSNDEFEIIKVRNKLSNDLILSLKVDKRPGLILFSSGSTGEMKVILLDFVRLFKKFFIKKRKFVTVSFLLFDHIGGLNTMLYCLSNGGSLVIAEQRDPNYILELIENHKVELLPTSPTFMNLILLGGNYESYDLSSLKLITYGTEPMLEFTLQKFRSVFPSIKLQQTYGLSEVGILRSKSESSDSLFLKVGGEGFETKIVDGILHIKAESSMVGYLNSPNPISKDGWFNTQDLVEEKGEFIRILGRKSDIINVGGQKVYPGEVENLIQEIESVIDVVVYGKENPIIGNFVCAKVRLISEITSSEEDDMRSIILNYCSENLDDHFKVPMEIDFTTKDLHNQRFKKSRNSNDII